MNLQGITGIAQVGEAPTKARVEISTEELKAHKTGGQIIFIGDVARINAFTKGKENIFVVPMKHS